MKLTDSEMVTVGIAIQIRRDNWMTLAKDRIERLKEVGVDITNDETVAYFVDRINDCTRIISKVRWAYVNDRSI